MSADRWMTCPKNGCTNPEENDPNSEYYGATRVDFDVGNMSNGEPHVSIRFWCTECGWNDELTKDNLNV